MEKEKKILWWRKKRRRRRKSNRNRKKKGQKKEKINFSRLYLYLSMIRKYDTMFLIFFHYDSNVPSRLLPQAAVWLPPPQPGSGPSPCSRWWFCYELGFDNLRFSHLELLTLFLLHRPSESKEQKWTTSTFVSTFRKLGVPEFLWSTQHFSFVPKTGL